MNSFSNLCLLLTTQLHSAFGELHFSITCCDVFGLVFFPQLTNAQEAVVTSDFSKKYDRVSLIECTWMQGFSFLLVKFYGFGIYFRALTSTFCALDSLLIMSQNTCDLIFMCQQIRNRSSGEAALKSRMFCLLRLRNNGGKCPSNT